MVALVLLPALAAAGCPCNFANLFTVEQVATDAAAQESFLQCLFVMECTLVAEQLLCVCIDRASWLVREVNPGMAGEEAAANCNYINSRCLMRVCLYMCRDRTPARFHAALLNS